MTDNTIEEIFYIKAVRYFRDHDNYNDSEPVDVLDENDEGFFLSAESAQARVDKLNKILVAEYEANENGRKRIRDAEVSKVERHNREAAAIRGGGMRKADAKIPAPFEPQTFGQYLDFRRYDGYVEYEVESMSYCRNDKQGT